MPRAKRKGDVDVHPFRALWSGVAVVLLLVLSIPMFIEAVQGQEAGTSPIGSETAALIAAFGDLGQQMNALKSEIQSLRGLLVVQQQTTGGSALGAGVPECLYSCRSKLSQCLASQKAAASPLGISQITPSPLAGQLLPLDKCRADANTCMNSCRPAAAGTVTCEDRCAVALGGCIDAAGSDAAKLAACRTSNQQCLITACLKRTPTAASMGRIPSGVCGDQCARDLAICRKGAAFDQDQLAACDAASRRCVSAICGGAPAVSTAPSQTAPSSPPAPAGQQITIKCENACTATFLACREKNAGMTDLLASCDSSYGGCREQCLQAIGGGYVSPTSTQ